MTANRAQASSNYIFLITENGKDHMLVDHIMLAAMVPLHDERYLRNTFQLNPITCPYLLIMCQNFTAKWFSQPIIEEFQTWKNSLIQWVDGTHNIHISFPEKVAPYITEFLLKWQAKL